GPGTFHDQPGLRGQVRAALYTGTYRWGAGAAVAATPVWGSNCALRAEAWQAVRTRVHRERGDVHDDLDLSFQLALAGRRIRFDPDLR
ncbi:C50 carotenoid glucosyltransferase CrtX, partial [Xanthomonas citri pv. citri]|nr:C50 carotenoid glucosyltransferase CrtX [Xanthomonas citri pv. citri]